MKATRVPTLFLAILLGLGGATNAVAQIEPGSCVNGSSVSSLDANDVVAWMTNQGTIAWGTFLSGASYFVPRNSENSPLFAHNMWIGGTVNGELRIAAETYGQGNGTRDYEMYPGPLNDDGTAVQMEDCSSWDRIWKVSQQDILDYDATGVATPDMADWPWEWGAPVIDGDDNPNNYNLAGGDRPDIIGNQSLYWIMNDVAGPHVSTQSDPIGLQVNVQAFSFARADALNQTTFYKYTLTYRGQAPLEDTRITLFSDPDLGDASDDLIGSDTTLSLGYVWNGGDSDATYGTPPAFGYDFFQGPLVPSPGDTWTDPDGTTYQDTTRLGMTVFNYFNNDGSGQGNPLTRDEFWRYMRGLWKDGSELRECGNGYQCDGPVTTFAYPGDPVAGTGWFEPDAEAADKRFLVTTGPFTMQPGDTQEIVFGMVFAQSTDRFASLEALKAADLFAQNAYDADFNFAQPAVPPALCDANSPNPNLLPGSGSCLEAAELDEELSLTWGYAPGDDGYLGDYVDEYTFRAVNDEGEEVDSTLFYEFEGFNLYEYGSARFEDNDRRLIATFDKANGITTVYNGAFDSDAGVFVPARTAQGSDSGLDYSFNVTGSFRHDGPLQNYTDYYYCLSTYAVEHERVALQEEVLAGGDTMTVNWGDVGEAVVESFPRCITVRPSNLRNADEGTTLGSGSGELVPVDSTIVAENVGQGVAQAEVVDPTKVTGDTYTVEWYEHTFDGSTVNTYDIVSSGSSGVIFNGGAYAEQTGGEVPLSEQDEDGNLVNSVVVADGLGFKLGSSTDLHSIVEVVGPGGADPCGPDAGSTPGCPVPGNNVRQSFNGTGQYVGYHEGTGSEATAPAFAPHDFEIRWGTLDEGFSYGYYGFGSSHVPGRLIKVPFTIWDVGLVPPGTENDPSDDVQMIPVLFSDSETPDDECTFGFVAPTIFGLGNITQRIYGYYPVDDDYAAYEAAAAPIVTADPNGCPEPPTTDPAGGLVDFGRGRPIQREIIEDATGGDQSIEDIAGSIMRFYTSDPSQPGDRFVFDTGSHAATRGEGLTQEDVDRIAVAPNPYMGVSAYESGNQERVARFTNLPERATIRIFTIDGTLIRTLEKDNSSRSFDWNLRTSNDLPIASGLYLIHIELPESGLERVLKFGVVNRQTQVDIL